MQTNEKMPMETGVVVVAVVLIVMFENDTEKSSKSNAVTKIT